MERSASAQKPITSINWNTPLLYRERRCFTIVEILIVITIISVIAGVVAIGVSSAVSDQRYRSETDLVLDKLRLAQDLMLIADADVVVKFTSVNEGLEMSLTTDSALTGAWREYLNRSKRVIKTIKAVEFDEKRTPFELEFLSGGSVMSRGVLKLFSPGREDKYICLYGYPHPIVMRSEEKNCRVEENPLFDSRLTFFTRREIEEEKSIEPRNGD